jgi:hypothetical protein
MGWRCRESIPVGPRHSLTHHPVTTSEGDAIVKWNTSRWSFLVIAAGLLLAMAASAEKPEKSSPAGGKAEEHRSERAAERANSQWQEDATRGQDRAAEVEKRAEDHDEDDGVGDPRDRKRAKDKDRDSHPEVDDPHEGSARDRDGKAGGRSAVDRKSSGEPDTDEMGRAKQPKGEARGFWQRLFGGGDDAPE